jgi:hypothetical protein
MGTWDGVRFYGFLAEGLLRARAEAEQRDETRHRVAAAVQGDLIHASKNARNATDFTKLKSA